jgi:hypothetical protein
MRRVAILAVLMASHTLAQNPASVTATGYITDTLCGKRGANHLHADHARRSVASGKAQYALYDEKTKQLYLLGGANSSQLTADSGKFNAEPWLGQRVRVTGTISASPITRAGESGGVERGPGTYLYEFNIRFFAQASGFFRWRSQWTCFGRPKAFDIRIKVTCRSVQT